MHFLETVVGLHGGTLDDLRFICGKCHLLRPMEARLTNR
jgi:ribosomal protein S27AE